MKGRWLLNLILLAVIGALAALALLKPGKETEVPKSRLTTLNAEGIDHIRIERSGQKPVELKKEAGQWRLTRPLSARANRFNIASLTGLASAETETTFPVPEDLNQYGLKPPMVRFWLNDTALEMGSQHPLKSDRYVRVGNRILLLPAQRLRTLENPYTDFIDSRLIEAGQTPIGIQFDKLKLVNKEGKWSLTPEDKDIKADQIESFTREWTHAHALSVDRYSGKPVTDTIRITLGAGDKARTLKLGILSRKPELVLYRKDEGLEYRFTEESGRRLLDIKAH